MTKNTVAKRVEQRAKIGPWDVAELSELVAAFQEVGANVEHLIALEGEADWAPRTSSFEPERVDELVRSIRRVLFDLTKALAGTVVAGAPDVASELASAFYVISGSVGLPALKDTPAREPAIRVSVMSSESLQKQGNGHHVDVALVALAFYEPGSKGSPYEYTDALVVRRDRETNERRVRHFVSEPNDAHFDRAVETRSHWLGISESPFAGDARPSWRPCT